MTSRGSLIPSDDTLAERYWRDGFVAPIDVVDAAAVAGHLDSLDRAEAELGPLHYRDKVHTVLRSPYELATHASVLDAVESFIGPDILIYNATYIIKEPGSPTHVAWHQDLTYWGLAEDDAQVSAWIALTPASHHAGCMRMVPGSHRRGQVEHTTVADEDNVLLLGQQIDGYNPSLSQLCPLGPGQASFHHGWTVHGSGPNRSDERRVGLNIQYLSTENHQTLAGEDTAMLVRGRDDHHHFGADRPPDSDLDPEAVARWLDLDRRMKETFTGAGGDPANPTQEQRR